MTEKRKLLENILSLFTLQGANYILPFITLPYLVRVLGPERLGIIAFAQAFIQYFVVLTDYGFNLSATRDVTTNRNNPKILNNIITAVMTIKITFTIIGGAVLYIIASYFTKFKTHEILYIIVYITVIGSTAFPLWLFQGLERMKQITILTIFARIVTTASIFIFIKEKNDYIYAALIQASTMTIAAIPAWIILSISNSYKITYPNFKTIKEQLQNGWHIFISTAAINLYTNSNMFILGLTTSPVSVAYFSVANKITTALLGLFQPIVSTLYPHISILATQSKYTAINYVKKISPYFVLFGTILSMILFFGSPDIIRLIAGSKFEESVNVLKWLSPLPLLISIGLTCGALTMLPLGMTRTFSRITIIGAAIDLVSIYPLISIFSTDGAAMANTITEFFISISMTLFLISHKNAKPMDIAQ